MQNFFWIVSVCILWAGFVTPVFAATVALTSATTTVHVGEVVSVSIIVDTELQSVNAFESVVTFPSEVLEFVSSDTSHSALSLWIESPTIQNGHDIHFSGIAPGGFTESDAHILTLLFKVIHTGQAAITLSHTKNLLNDGAGTAATVTERNLHLTVSEGVAVPFVPSIDDELPEPFTPLLVTDPDLYDNADTLVFSTTDKGSGIDHYEIKEGLFGRYMRAASPYHIRDTSRTQTISVKAIDRNGNERIELFYPQNWRPWYKQTQILGGIVVGCLLVLWVLFIVVRKLWVRGRFSS